MIAAKDRPLHLSPKEYFDWEAQQIEKYEYIDGKVYAMSGGSVNHSRIAVRLTSLFDTHLENTDCITGNSDLKIQIVNTTNYTYPDASVTCDNRDKINNKYITYPSLIVEVLPDSTEAYDRGGKFRLYRRNPALQDQLYPHRDRPVSQNRNGTVADSQLPAGRYRNAEQYRDELFCRANLSRADANARKLAALPLHTNHLLQRCHHLNQIVLTRHHFFNRLICRRNLIQHALILSALDALGLLNQVV